MSYFKERTRKLLRNSQHGQSIILLAIGFIALAAFVGLVTDISIMFVRFSTLRRAVDAAAIAAAGQIREGTDYGTVALAARQYIVLHGLQPNRVWVDTCETDIAEWRKTNPESSDPVGKKVADLMPETDLCDWHNPRKLVRVTAQIDSETTFLKLIGIDNFVITSSATSETAALDIVLVLDKSITMANETTEVTYTSAGLLPIPLDAGGNRAFVVNRDGSDYIPTLCYQNSSGGDNLQWGGCCNDPGAGSYVYLNTATGTWDIYTDGTVTGLDGAGVPIVTGANGQHDAGEEGLTNNWPDGDYSDLICQPFKQVKDAARNFISRLDFVRGDRVSLVTFDRVVEIQRPNQNATIPAMMTSETDATNTLNKYVGLFINPNRRQISCIAYDAALNDVRNKLEIGPTDPDFIDVHQPAFNNLPSALRHWSYESFAQCTNTNIGDSIRFANGVLTNPETIRRDAVWVAIILTDGAANASYQNDGNLKAMQANADGTPAIGAYLQPVDYGDFGFCPWYTFCNLRPREIQPGVPNPFLSVQWLNYDYNATEKPDVAERDYLNQTLQAGETWEAWGNPDSPFVLTTDPNLTIMPAQRPGGKSDVTNLPSYSECNDAHEYLASVEPNAAQVIINSKIYCSDLTPNTRHFCLTWSNDMNQNGIPLAGAPECSREGRYDADDYARDMADWAGLIELAPGVPGNFIAMFSIGFSLSDEDGQRQIAAAALLRYLSDAGDNGVIDRNMEQDWRDNHILNYGTDGNGPYPASFGSNDPCFGAAFDADPTEWCGQYYYANNVQELDAVFEAIASRLFSRIAR